MSTQPEPSASSGLTRRDFLGGTAGLSIGAALPLGAATLLQGATAGAATLASPAVMVALEIEGSFAGYVDRVQGGAPALRFEPQPTGLSSLKTPIAYVEPLELGFLPGAMNSKFYGWFGKSLTTSPGMRVRLALVYYDQTTGKEAYRLSMTNARIVDVLSPRFDATSLDAVRFTVRIDADKSAHDKLAGTAMPPRGARLSSVLESYFLMYIQDREVNGRAVARIDPIASRLGAGGGSWTPDVVRVRLQPVGSAPYYGWISEMLSGKYFPAQGVVQILSQDFSKVMGTIDLTGMMPLRVTTPPAASGVLDQITAEFLCESVSFRLEGFA